MLLKKEGFPEEGDLVLSTVTKIYFNSVFVVLDIYENKTGMIHISEISPGRIRSLNDYVTVGKKIVCKVLKVDKKKGHIDLSLRRVNEMQRKNKIEEIKQEQKAEKLIEFVSKELKADVQKIYTDVFEAISKKYDLLHQFFIEVSTDKVNINKFNIDPKVAEILERIIRERIKPPIVEVRGEFIIKSYAPEGVEEIKSALDKGWKKDKDAIEMKYFGAGRYNISIKSKDYKEAEKILKSVIEIVTKNIEKSKGEVEFKRIYKE
ncbi:translation initiation factor IF-2 subunit alpha [Candidatus Woesearchaeota archaeon]|nr:translation initiation factor IF-2 subunit alpha [Candidatus Woesearchaeota archaeon]